MIAPTLEERARTRACALQAVSSRYGLCAIRADISVELTHTPLDVEVYILPPAECYSNKSHARGL